MKITVYSTPTCPWCVKVKEYLNNKNVGFNDINVAEDRNGAMEMVQKSGQRGVPVIDIEGNIIIGFNEGKLDKLIDMYK